MTGSLNDYKRRRDFRKTPEPTEGKGKKDGFFVVQKHEASRLHYDFRLAVDGVLKSWAVPKGPATDPAEKRLAVRTEDHPLAYAGFEGVIPEGEYGAGTVMVWDRGNYENAKDNESIGEGLDKGHISVVLDGEKLKGGYALTKSGREKDQWLLVKKRDDAADARRNPVSTQPDSVLTGRSLEDIASDEGDSQ